MFNEVDADRGDSISLEEGIVRTGSRAIEQGVGVRVHVGLRVRVRVCEHMHIVACTCFVFRVRLRVLVPVRVRVPPPTALQPFAFWQRRSRKTS